MATIRNELSKYLGTVIEIQATIERRSGGRNGYGWLLQGIRLPDGDYLDHCWVGGGHGEGHTVRDNNLTILLPVGVRCKARAAEYYSEGSERHGNGGYGIGFDGIFDIEVSDGADGWISVETAAKIERGKAADRRKQEKLNGDYHYPGSWTYTTGVLHVKAAKSACPGSLCFARSKGGMNDKLVKLLDQTLPGVWTFTEDDERIRVAHAKYEADRAKWEALVAAAAEERFKKEKETIRKAAADYDARKQVQPKLPIAKFVDGK